MQFQFTYVHTIYVTRSGKTGLIATITDIHFLSVHESYTHVLPRNTKYLIIDGQVYFYRRLFYRCCRTTGCILWPWRALIGLYGVQNCSRQQSWPPLGIRISLCPILKAQYCSSNLNGCFNPPTAPHPPPPTTTAIPYRLNQ